MSDVEPTNRDPDDWKGGYYIGHERNNLNTLSVREINRMNKKKRSDKGNDRNKDRKLDRKCDDTQPPNGETGSSVTPIESIVPPLPPCGPRPSGGAMAMWSWSLRNQYRENVRRAYEGNNPFDISDGQKFLITKDRHLAKTDYYTGIIPTNSGGIIILPARFTVWLSLADVIDAAKRALKVETSGNFRFHGDYIGAISFGNFFKNEYSKGDSVFNNESLCVCVRGLNASDVIAFAQCLCDELGLQKEVLVKKPYESYPTPGLSADYYLVRGDNPKTEYAAAPPVKEYVGSAPLPDRHFTLRYEAGPGGKLVGGSPQVRDVTINSWSCALAVADDGYEFVSWSDGVKSVARTDKTVASDICVTAIFAPVKQGGDA